MANRRRLSGENPTVAIKGLHLAIPQLALCGESLRGLEAAKPIARVMQKCQQHRISPITPGWSSPGDAVSPDDPKFSTCCSARLQKRGVDGLARRRSTRTPTSCRRGRRGGRPGRHYRRGSMTRRSAVRRARLPVTTPPAAPPERWRWAHVNRLRSGLLRPRGRRAGPPRISSIMSCVDLLDSVRPKGCRRPSATGERPVGRVRPGGTADGRSPPARLRGGHRWTGATGLFDVTTTSMRK